MDPDIYGWVKGHTNRCNWLSIVPSGNIEYSARTSDYINVLEAELVALQMAVQWVFQNNIKRALICMDSVSALISIKTSCQDSVTDIISVEMGSDCQSEKRRVMYGGKQLRGSNRIGRQKARGGIFFQ